MTTHLQKQTCELIQYCTNINVFGNIQIRVSNLGPSRTQIAKRGYIEWLLYAQPHKHMLLISRYGVVTISTLLEIIRLFCKI